MYSESLQLHSSEVGFPTILHVKENQKKKNKHDFLNQINNNETNDQKRKKAISFD